MNRHIALGTLPDLLDLRGQSLPELSDRLIRCQGWNEFEERQMSAALQIAQILHADDTHRGRPYQFHNVRAGLRVVDVHYLGIRVVAAGIAGGLHDAVEDHDLDLIELYNSGSQLFGDEPRDRLSIPTDLDKRQAVALEIIRLTFGGDVARGIAGVTNPPDFTKGKSQHDKIHDARVRVKKAVEHPDCWALKVADATDHSADDPLPGSETEKNLAYYHLKNFVTLDELRLRLMDEEIRNTLTSSAVDYFYGHYHYARDLVPKSQRDYFS